MGYSVIDASRNSFFRLHLPIFEVLIKTGIVGSVFYMYFVYINLVKRNIYSYFFALMFLTIFSNNKEMILLSLFFVRLSNFEDINVNLNKSYVRHIRNY